MRGYTKAEFSNILYLEYLDLNRLRRSKECNIQKKLKDSNKLKSSPIFKLTNLQVERNKTYIKKNLKKLAY